MNNTHGFQQIDIESYVCIQIYHKDTINNIKKFNIDSI